MDNSQPKRLADRPYNLEAEQGILGALLIQNDVYDDFSDFLKPVHFFDPLHAKLYEKISSMIAAGSLVSVVIMKSVFADDKDLRSAGGDKYLADLYANATTLTNTVQYAKLVYALALRRGLINVATEIAERAKEAGSDISPDQQIEQAEHALYNLAERGTIHDGFMDFKQGLTTTIDMIGNAVKSESKLTGISTTYEPLDRALGGLQKGDLVVVAARPGMGKTALACNMAFEIAKAHCQDPATGAVVGFFSLEMSVEQLSMRILGDETRIAPAKIRTGDLRNEEYEKIMKAAENLENLPIYIDHTGSLPLSQLIARARRMKRQHNLGLIVVDYLQLVVSDKRRSESRVYEVAEITQGLKALAKDLEIPIIALSQLSRQVESRDNKRPLLSDLRDSGSIEQDADVVLFIYREEYYLIRNEPDEPNTPAFIKWQERMNLCSNKAELIVGKNRHGPTPLIQLGFVPELMRFSELGDQWQAKRGDQVELAIPDTDGKEPPF